MDVAYRSLHGPLLAVLAAARDRGEIHHLQNPPLISGTILSLAGGAQVSAYAGGHDPRVADALVDVLLDGLRPREGGES